MHKTVAVKNHWSKPLLWLAATLATLACAAPAKVEAQGGANVPAVVKTGFRVATYNVEFLSSFIDEGRRRNLHDTITSLNADVIAFQEVDDRKALADMLGPEWQVGIADLADEDQELAVAVKLPHTLVEFNLVFPEQKHEYAFPNRRDVLRAKVKTTDGQVITFYSVHFKSRQGGRKSTERQRVGAASLIAAFIKASQDEHHVVLGDLNDAPDDRCANILETGDSNAGPGEAPSSALMVNLTEPLAEQDYVTEAVYELYKGQAEFRPIALGAYADNARLRDQDYRYPQDVQVRQVFFDQILATNGLAKFNQMVKVHAPASAMQGRRGSSGTVASDHLPVFADFEFK